MYIYSLPPIDHWIGWMNEDQFVSHFNEQMFYGEIAGAREQIAQARDRAFTIAKTCGWEGDLRSGPFYSGIPGGDDGDGQYLIGWKQDNNGQTFIASPYKLPWLGGKSASD